MNAPAAMRRTVVNGPDVAFGPVAVRYPYGSAAGHALLGLLPLAFVVEAVQGHVWWVALLLLAAAAGAGYGIWRLWLQTLRQYHADVVSALAAERAELLAAMADDGFELALDDTQEIPAVTDDAPDPDAEVPAGG